MKKQKAIITIVAVFSLLWASSEAFSYADQWSVPSWMDPFANPRPVYRYDWVFGTGETELGENGEWYNTYLYPDIGKSRGDGTAYTSESRCYWTADSYLRDRFNGFSLSNNIGDWIDAIGSGRAVIRYTIRQDYGSTIDNSDIIELGDDEVETIVKHGHGVADSLGVDQDTNINALEWNPDFDDENLVFRHDFYGQYDSNGQLQDVYGFYVSVGCNMDDENVYFTCGATAELDEGGNLTGTARNHQQWPGGNYFFDGAYRAHHADICYEIRTYQPVHNLDGPESPYEWLYDASGDMYEPTDGSGSPADTPIERANKLVGCHPQFPDDDAMGETEFYADSSDHPLKYVHNDKIIWYNHTAFGMGVLVRGVFVESWRLAGKMLGQEFWNDDPDYWWDPIDGRIEDETDSAVAGYDVLNNFMRYVFDIDALVVEDADGDGQFDVGDDYVLFSVVDDSLYSKYEQWHNSGVPLGGGLPLNDDVDTPYDDVYFDGDTIFLYDGTSVTTFFDAEAGIFFGQAIDTATGDGTGMTLWSMYDLYDLEALDIGIIPEPSTIFLMIGSASGLAVLAGIMRRKMR
ncbi:MAG: PEP-CTERM sorting domain-containing protein [Planctomycetota bacterium]